MNWQPIDTAPKDGLVMFVVRAFNVEWKPGFRYTSDPYCVWVERGEFVRWPHAFAPTHWAPLPEPPK